MGQTLRLGFAQWLRNQLREKGWMVSEFANAVGVRPSAVYRWTAGQRVPTDGQIERIAEVLELPSSALWDELARDGVTPIGVATKVQPRRVVSEGPPLEDRPFARWLREQMAERGWTAGFLARQIDLDVVTVRAWMGGLRTPASVQFPNIAKALDVEADVVSAKTRE